MVVKKNELQIFPNEIWLKIFKFLDLKSQNMVTNVNRNFLFLVVSIWKTKVIKLKPLFDQLNEDYKSVRLKVVMNAHLNDKAVPVDQFLPPDLFDILSKYKALVTDGQYSMTEHGYAFFHDYSAVGCKFLDLYQKWPRPGAKSLDKFTSGNKDLVCLHISDCRENIEAVHYLTTHCTKLKVLRLFATDPLIPYTEIFKLKDLKFLELQFDSFYREHRDDFISSLNQLPLLQVLKLQSCYGMTDQHVFTILEGCKALRILHLPFNTKIEGWFLESLLERLKSSDTHDDKISQNLSSLKLFINTAYTDLHTVIPDLYARTIQTELKNFGLEVQIEYVHKKLTSFNPKDLHV